MELIKNLFIIGLIITIALLVFRIAITLVILLFAGIGTTFSKIIYWIKNGEFNDGTEN